MCLHNVALEILIEKISAAHRPETQRVVHPLFAQAMEVLTEIEQLHDIAGLERCRIWRLPQQQRLDKTALSQHVAQIPLVSFRIPLRMPRNFPAERIVIVVEREVLTVAHQRATTLVRNNLQPETRQLQS